MNDFIALLDSSYDQMIYNFVMQPSVYVDFAYRRADQVLSMAEYVIFYRLNDFLSWSGCSRDEILADAFGG